MYTRCLEASTEVFYSMFGKPCTKPQPAEKSWEQGLRGGGGNSLRPLGGAFDSAVTPQRKAADAEKSNCAPRVYNDWKERLEDANFRRGSYIRRSRPAKEDNSNDMYRDILRANQGGLISAVASANSRYSNSIRIRPGTAQPGSRQWGRDESWPQSVDSDCDLTLAPTVELSHASLFVGSHSPTAPNQPGALGVTGRLWASSANELASIQSGFPMQVRPTSGGAGGRVHRPLRQTARCNIPQSVLQSLHRREQQQQQRKATLTETPVSSHEKRQNSSMSTFSGTMECHPPNGWQPRLVPGKSQSFSKIGMIEYTRLILCT